MVTKKSLALASALILAGCANMPSSGSQLLGNEPALTRVGGTAVIGDLRITPLSVTEDSRCPVDVQCVQAGRVVVNTRLSSPTGDDTRDLILGQPSSFAGGSITLTEVWPEARSNQFPAQSNYSFRFTYDNY